MLSVGKMIVFAPALRAATVFSLSPPIRKTLPVTVNSPVMAMVGSSGLFNARESSDVAIVIPAEGPVLVSCYFNLDQAPTIFLDSAFRTVKMQACLLEELIFRELLRH